MLARAPAPRRPVRRGRTPRANLRWMAFLPGLGALLLATAPASPELRERVEAILRGGEFQAELPKGLALPKLDLSLGPLAVLLRILLAVALGVLVVLAVSWLARRLATGARDAVVAAPLADAPAAIPIASAEALAAEGRWADAIHALLLDTLEALSRASRLAPSLTSREIVERVPLDARAREALAGLVAAVEISRFGGAPAREDDYRACLSRFHAFLHTYRSAA